MKNNNKSGYVSKVPGGLVIKYSKNKGRGVFAVKDFEKNEVIERAPIILLNEKDSALCEKSKLDTYIFAWKKKYDGAIALGYGSLYNHSYNPNSSYSHDYKRKEIVFRSFRNIKKGEELTVNYNRNPEDRSPINWIKTIH